MRVQQSTSGIELSVEDNGPGIPEDERDKVLERFKRGSTGLQTAGSGLGLAIVREIAVTHGAEMRVEARTYGRGTRVSVVFPDKA